MSFILHVWLNKPQDFEQSLKLFKQPDDDQHIYNSV